MTKDVWVLVRSFVVDMVRWVIMGCWRRLFLVNDGQSFRVSSCDMVFSFYFFFSPFSLLE